MRNHHLEGVKIMAGLMGSSRTQRRDSEELEALKQLNVKIGQLQGQVDALTEIRDRSQELRDMTAQVEKLRAEKERIEAGFKREREDIEHKTGLLLEKSEQDIALARREAEVKVREDNLDKDRERFQSEVTFQRDFMEREVRRMEELVRQVLSRLPDVNASLNVMSGVPSPVTVNEPTPDAPTTRGRTSR